MGLTGIQNMKDARCETRIAETWKVVTKQDQEEDMFPL